MNRMQAKRSVQSNNKTFSDQSQSFLLQDSYVCYLLGVQKDLDYVNYLNKSQQQPATNAPTRSETGQERSYTN